MSWSTSDRRDRLPSWWPVSRRRILARDPKCRCFGCPKCGTMGEGGRCMRSSTEVDHIVPGDNHKDANLHGLCTPCHSRKSSEEGNAARAAQHELRKRPKPPERHPGEIRRPS